MIKLFGNPMSRAMRNQWLLNECGVPYEVVEVDQRKGDQKADWFKEINPNAKVPALQDGDVNLCESVAINLYIGRKYGGKLWPSTIEDEGRTFQWSLWSMTEIEPPLVVLLVETLFRTDETRDAAAVEKAKETLIRPLTVLEKTLADRAYLLGADFTVADINVTSVLAIALMVQLDLSPYPKTKAWLELCLSRPANQIEGSPFCIRKG